MPRGRLLNEWESAERVTLRLSDDDWRTLAADADDHYQTESERLHHIVAHYCCEIRYRRSAALAADSVKAALLSGIASGEGPSS